MRILGPRIFFGGKILHFQTDVNYLEYQQSKKKRRMRILNARIFSKSFGGKNGGDWTAATMATVKTKNLPTVKCNKHLNERLQFVLKSFNKWWADKIKCSSTSRLKWFCQVTSTPFQNILGKNRNAVKYGTTCLQLLHTCSTALKTALWITSRKS